MLLDTITLKPVERVGPLSKEELFRRYISTGTPVVLEGAVSDWPCVRKWTMAYLVERCGTNEVQLRDIDPLSSSVSIKKSTLGAYVDDIRTGRHGAEYLAEVPLKEVMPQVISDVGQSPFTASQPQNLLVMLGADTYAPAHFHPLQEAISAQIVGRRRFVLFGPEQTRFLSPRPWWRRLFNFAQVDFLSKDASAYPLLRHLSGYETVLTPGDCIYIPVHFWHAVLSLDGFSILLADFFPSSWRRYHYPYPGLAVGLRYAAAYARQTANRAARSPLRLLNAMSTAGRC